jgi:protein-S-isoprenylcysteine O-methyltransferase Ste14
MKAGIPPLALTAIFGLAMWLAARVWPALNLRLPGRALLVALVAGAGLVVCALGVLPFHRAGTTLDPTRPERVSSLVTTGIYAVSRNPMYLGFLLLLIAWGFYLGHWPGLLLGPIGLVLYLNRVQIRREEQVLRAAFGARYEEYSRRVRRWL